MKKITQKNNADKLSPLQLIFLQAKELISQGEDIIELGVGDPDRATLDKIKDSAINAVHNHCNYIPAGGSRDLKEAIAENYHRKGCEVDINEVVASGGSRIVIDNILRVIIEPGDAVIVPAPYYPPYIGMVETYGGESVILDTKDDGFKITAENITKVVKKLNKDKKIVKALIINTPNNPTGVEYEIEELKKIAVLAEKEGVLIISDECYSNFSKNKDFTFRSIYQKAIVVDSCSKTYAMTGYRVGWGVMDKDLVRQVDLKLNLHISSFSSISEKAAITALAGEGIDDYNEQRKYTLKWAKELDVIEENSGQAGFYAFIDISKYYEKLGVKTSLEFSELALKQAGVSLAPGSAFGDYDNFVRISYCVKMEKLVKALDSIARLIRTQYIKIN